MSHMSKSDNRGTLPGWTLLVSLLGWALALTALWASRDLGLSWWISVSVSLLIALASVLLERYIERRYLPSSRNH
jgi:hypothetical protein